MYTLYLTQTQLDRAQDLVQDHCDIRLWHVLADYSDGFATHWEDRYVLLLDCAPETYTLLCLV